MTPLVDRSHRDGDRQGRHFLPTVVLRSNPERSDWAPSTNSIHPSYFVVIRTTKTIMVMIDSLLFH